MNPRIFLAIDNCFASKRWCRPATWMPLVKELGLRYVEASADNEIDPLYSCDDYLAAWADAVKLESKRHDVRVANVYSGHGTYATLGFGHHDPRVRQHLVENWGKPMLALAGAIGANMGFCAHGFSEETLLDPEAYKAAHAEIVRALQTLAAHAEMCGVNTLGMEQMYSPHQAPWTLQGAVDLLRRVNDKTRGCPLYVTIDTGHQSGQARFLSPDAEALERFMVATRAGEPCDVYVGPWARAKELKHRIRQGWSLDDLQSEMQDFMAAFPHLFCEAIDGDPYAWCARLGCYSPIVHLQQTDGHASSHLCFTKENNARGRIHAPGVLEAIWRSYAQEEPGMPPKVSDIFFTLEPFLPTACNSAHYVDQIAESVAYWREFVPEDGMLLSDAVARCRG